MASSALNFSSGQPLNLPTILSQIEFGHYYPPNTGHGVANFSLRDWPEGVHGKR